jgi:hypothetical protein
MLKELFTSKIRVKIIKLFLDNLNESFHVREITRRVGTEINAVRRELSNLHSIGFLRRRVSGNKVLYSVRADFLILPELLTIFAKEFGFPYRIKNKARDLGYVKYLAVHTSLLKRQVSSKKIDILIVGNVSLSRLEDIISKEQEKLECEINYSAISEEELKFFKTRRDKFYTDFISKPFFMVVGEEEEFLNS